MGDVDSKITMKLLIDAHSQKVLFGEAGKDFVDFMFSLLTLPLGSVINLLSPPAMIGSIGKLYQSVENLKETYFVTKKNRNYITTTRNFKCLSCSNVMGTEVPLLVPSVPNSSVRGGGFVKGVITYMITDDLEVTPMSAISSITLMNRFSKNNDVKFEEKVVVVGMEEGLALLRASLNSPTALTDVFCSSLKRQNLRLILLRMQSLRI